MAENLLKTPTRGQLSKIANGDPYLIKALEKLFQQVGETSIIGKTKIIQIGTDPVIAPQLAADELWVDTDSGEKTVLLPTGPTGNNYRIINIGTSANNVILTTEAGTKLFGEEEDEYLIDNEALIVAFVAAEGWY